MKQTTRDYDLEDLEQYRDSATDSETKKKRGAILEMVYEQAKDPTLEKLRVMLTDAMKRGDLRLMWQIRNQVIQYASNPSFIRNLYDKMRKSSQDRAEVYVADKK